MSKILRKIRAGRVVFAVVYTPCTAGDSPKARAQKQRASTAAREKLNARTSFQKLERTLAANFDDGDLFVTLSQSYVPFSRYLVNTVFITFVGTAGHLLIASMAAFVLAKYDFPGGKTFFSIVVTALMFSGYVTGIPNYVIMSKLNMIDTYWAVILPAFAAPIGLFLMKQFMEGLPTALIEAAHLDGASEMRIFWSIVMPNVKPAWLTVIIFSVQSLWNTNAATVIYSESKKTLVYALQQIQAGGVARTGQAAAVTVIVMLVPISIFILSQSQILETMASSGLKD